MLIYFHHLSVIVVCKVKKDLSLYGKGNGSVWRQRQRQSVWLKGVRGLEGATRGEEVLHNDMIVATLNEN